MSEQAKYRVLIADDHAMIRRGLRKYVESLPGTEVCGEAATASETIEQIEQTRPDLVLLDLTFPDMPRVQVLVRVRQKFPSTDVLVVTMWDVLDLVRIALMLGARGYVLKSDGEDVLLTAIETIRRGSLYYTPSVMETEPEPEPFHYGLGRFSKFLTVREIEVLKLIASGNTNQDAAEKLHISRRTIEAHRAQIMEKLKLGSLAEVVRYALREGLIYLEPRFLDAAPKGRD